MFDYINTFERMGNFLGIQNVASTERIASRLAGPSTAFVDAEDLEGDHVDALPALQQMDIRIPVQGWGIGLGQGSFENVPLHGDVCSVYEAGAKNYAIAYDKPLGLLTIHSVQPPAPNWSGRLQGWKCSFCIPRVATGAMDIEALQASVLRYFSGNIDPLQKVGLYHKSANMLN